MMLFRNSSKQISLYLYIIQMLLERESIEKIHTYRISPDIPMALQWDETQNGVNVLANNKVNK